MPASLLATPVKPGKPEIIDDSWSSIQSKTSKPPIQNYKSHVHQDSKGSNIRVLARFRPLEKAEFSYQNESSSFQFLPDNSTLLFTSKEIKPNIVNHPKLDTPPIASRIKASFTFDRVFTPENTQQELFDYVLEDTVDDLLNGYNGCVLAYGQTGSGKTYTMMGPQDSALVSFVSTSKDNSSKDLSNDDLKFTRKHESQEQLKMEFNKRNSITELAPSSSSSTLTYSSLSSATLQSSNLHSSAGAIPRIIEAIFKAIANSPNDTEYKVQISYMEIYQERVRDLLTSLNPKCAEKQRNSIGSNSTKNKVKTISPTPTSANAHNLSVLKSSSGVYVKDLTEIQAKSLEEVLSIMETGNKLRATRSTLMNSNSSRSHAIFSLKLLQKSHTTQSQKSGQLFLVDLAGSENVKRTGASGQSLQESKQINKSLSALGNLINALTDPNSNHMPYRDSKLTRVLQEAIGGNSRTSLIITCSSSYLDEAETLSTLRFGSRAKKIHNKAVVNIKKSPEDELRSLLRIVSEEYEEEKRLTTRLESELDQWRRGCHPSMNSWILKALNLDSYQSSDSSKGPTHRRSVSLFEGETGRNTDNNNQSHLRHTKNSKTLDGLSALSKQERRLLGFIQSRAETLIRLQRNINKLLLNPTDNIISRSRSNIGIAISIDDNTSEHLDNPNSVHNFKLKLEKSLYTIDELRNNIQEISKENQFLNQILTTNSAKCTPLSGSDNHFEADFLKSKLSELLLENADLKYKQSKSPMDEAQQGSKYPHLRTHESLREYILDLELTKKTLMRHLQSRCERIVELESKTKKVYDEHMGKMKEHVLRTKFKKMALLERNLTQVLEVQNELVEQNKILKRDVEATQTILEIRNQRINDYELLLSGKMSTVPIWIKEYLIPALRRNKNI